MARYVELLEGVASRKIIFPRAFAFAIDDLGWNEGGNLFGGTPSGPLRAGVKRKFDLKDYKAIVDVGKSVGTRIQCLFILSEMDRENILMHYPTTTYLREKWNNSSRVCEEQNAIMKYVCEQAAHMEFGLHGIGHEYWADDGIQRRAEWYNMTDREPWSEDSLREHLHCFREIMAQYNITPRNGHSFPESFVPCAYSYYWNPSGDYSLGKLLSEAGVKYANTDFAQIPELSPPQGVNAGGFDHGVHVINRMNFGNPWYVLQSLPTVQIDMQCTDIIESHWANWLAQDDFIQHEVTAEWVDYYLTVQRVWNRYVAKNTEQLHSQWLYNKYTTVRETENGTVEIDNTQMPMEAYQNNKLGNMVLKIKVVPEEHISAKLNDEFIPAYFEQEGFAFLYLPPLEQQKYILRYTRGKDAMPLYVYNDGTYNVYGLNKQDNRVELFIKMYGQQNIKIKCKPPLKVASSTDGLVIKSHSYNCNSGMLNVLVEATNMQGKRGEIKLLYERGNV
jgi:hypothetical protein